MAHLAKQSRALAIVGLAAALPLGLGGCRIAPLRFSPDAGIDSSRDAAQEQSDTAPRLETGAPVDAADGRDGNAPDGAPDADAHGGVDAADARDGANGSDVRPVDSSNDSAAATTCATCTTWGQPQAQGTSPSILPELSGLAASRLHPGLLYTHND
jgi:hypothetical protein